MLNKEMRCSLKNEMWSRLAVCCSGKDLLLEFSSSVPILWHCLHLFWKSSPETFCQEGLWGAKLRPQHMAGYRTNEAFELQLIWPNIWKVSSAHLLRSFIIVTVIFLSALISSEPGLQPSKQQDNISAKVCRYCNLQHNISYNLWMELFNGVCRPEESLKLAI